MSQRIWIPLLLIATGIAGIGLGRLYVATKPEPPATAVLESGTLIVPARALPDFQLIDQDGRPTGPRIFQNHWTLVFFGFTHCPEACPTTLATLGTVRGKLAALLPPALVPAVMLVSVDPERDTAPILKAYLGGFGPGFTGLTGDPEGVRAYATALGVPYQKTPMGEDYMVDHSMAILLVNPAGELAALFTGLHDADRLTRDFLGTVSPP